MTTSADVSTTSADVSTTSADVSNTYLEPVQKHVIELDLDLNNCHKKCTRNALDSGFRSCSDCDSPSYKTKPKLTRQLQDTPVVKLQSPDNDHILDDVFSDNDVPVSTIQHPHTCHISNGIVRQKSHTFSFPCDGNKLDRMCKNVGCHCSACCGCLPDNLQKFRHNCYSWHFHSKSDNQLKFSRINNITNNVSTVAPTEISSWGHYYRRSELHYKYARSDYSSDSDDADGAYMKPKVKLKESRSWETPSKELHPDVNVNLQRLTNAYWQKLEGFSSKYSDAKIVPQPDVPPVCRQHIEQEDSSERSLFSLYDTVTRDTGNDNRNPAPALFKDGHQKFIVWFRDLSDKQRNIVLRNILSLCDLPQLHLLSMSLQDQLHAGCPHNCQDILSWVPNHLATKIFMYLDPVSLCQASLVCQTWYTLSSTPSLWRHFCCLTTWRLSKPAEHKQVIRYMNLEGSIQWKGVFAERYRLRQNWLLGRCSVRTFEGHSQGISCVQFDDTRIVSGSSDKTIKVWNIRTNAPWSVQTLVGHSGTVRCLHLEGKKLVSGSTDCTIKVWDLSTQDSWSSIACKVTMVGHTDTVRCLQVGEDKVISGSYDKMIKIWDIKTGECRNTLSGHQAAVLCVYYNDSKIVSGSCDKTIKVWNLEHCLMTLEGHKNAVTCLQFDSTRIISGSLDCTLKFWDFHTGSCINTIDWMDSEGHTGVIRCLQADAWRLVSAQTIRQSRFGT